MDMNRMRDMIEACQTLIHYRFHSEEKQKSLDEMTKQELIAEIKRLQAIIKKLLNEKAELEGLYLTAQSSQLGSDGLANAKSRLSIS